MKLRNNEYIELLDYKFKFIKSPVAYYMCGIENCCHRCKLESSSRNNLCYYMEGITDALDDNLGNICIK